MNTDEYVLKLVLFKIEELLKQYGCILEAQNEGVVIRKNETTIGLI